MTKTPSEVIEAAKRLKAALELLGYNSKQPKHWRHNLVTQIETFAALNNDDELESLCSEMALAIKNEA
ncbi:hypothetical protein [Pseudoalteromonas galatheae]|uniref:hypothetical protein n=1 Tax=Pseudoalteromonas galatheae TaxID=579562 RepID=UPI0030D32DCB